MAGPVWLPPATLLIALVLTQLPLQQQMSRAAGDAMLRAVARPSAFDDVLVVDFDDASLRALRPEYGAWPPSRAVHARVLETLRAAGAATVVYDIVFAEPREGDARFAAALAARPDAALAAAGRRDAATDEMQAPEAVEPFATRPGPDARLTAWPTATLPSPALLRGLNHRGAVGVITATLDADGQLRRLPLLQDVGGRVLPHLALSALLLENDQGMASLPASGGLGGDTATLALGPYRWPVDSQAAVNLVLASNLAQMPTLAAAKLLGAMGPQDAAMLRAHVQGRHVFVGSSAFFGDMVSTPQGRLHGTTMIAGAHTALREGAVLRPAGPLTAALLWLLALTPVLCTTWRGRPHLGRDAAAALTLAFGMAAGAWAAARHAGLQLSPLPATVCVAVGFALTLALQLRLGAEANRTLREGQLAAEAANRAKSEFLARVSHELRTPLHAVLGMADVLSETRLAPAQQHCVDIFRSAGQTLVQLIDDLLDLSKIESGQLAQDPQPFVLATVLDEVGSLLGPRATAKGLTLSVKVASNSERPVGTVVLGDARRFYQVLVNLVANAIKFTTVGSVTVRVDRIAGANGRDPLRVQVSDTGIGIAASERERIFEPFAQADGSITRRFGGTGLGLSISNDLVQLMGGTIAVHSEPGHGSIFRFTLPMPPTTAHPVPEASAAAGAPADPSVVKDAALPEAPAPAPVAATRPGAMILLAEDNEVNVMVIEAMLDGTGHQVQVATDGADAVARYTSGCFDLVLMDVQMPVMDGHAATRAIRLLEAAEARPRTPVVALTANAFEAEREASFAAGCDAHLVKPLRRQALLAAIDAHARKRPAAR